MPVHHFCIMAAKKITRYGIGEWYGRDFASLSPSEMRAFATAKTATLPCPFREGACTKKGGVCSLRVYEKTEAGTIPQGKPVTTCPQRFKEAGCALKWISSTLIGTESPEVIKEVPFLKSTVADVEGADAVAQVDMVLVNQAASPMNWCCVEMQAVYFSGPGMDSEFSALAAWKDTTIPFPQKVRRPDFRSSGPKRLMPQLQIKVPTISRWGKKMAVLIDRSFWDSLGAMTEVRHVSNCDVAWFVVDYQENDGRWRLVPGEVHYTTLDRAVEGLTAGVPISLGEFEKNIIDRLARSM